MTYHLFDFLDEQQRNILRALIKLAEKYFEANGKDAVSIAEEIFRHGVVNLYPVMDGPRDLAAMNRLDRALVEVTNALSENSITAYAYYVLMVKLSNVDGDNEYLEIDSNDENLPSAIFLIRDKIGKYREAIAKTRAEIKESPFTRKSPGKFNLAAISLVDACHYMWEKQGFSAPSLDLNPASRFACFLGDVFEACNVVASPRGAFQAWARQQQRIQSSV